MADELGPKDHAEAIAIFRAQVIGPLLCRPLVRGERLIKLSELSQERFQVPDGHERSFSVPTLERWLYDYKRGGLDALRPKGRKRGFALELSDEQRELLCEIRRENPTASASLIVRTLIADGRLQEGGVSMATVRRLFVSRGLDRVSLRESLAGARRRWEAAHPNALWHADVCHGPSLTVGERKLPLRIHAILDDASRYVVAISACDNEREASMLELFVKAVRARGKPDVLYLDRGSTYRGDALKTACARLGVRLIHAKPRDPQARGKMERYWRTLRGGCLSHLGQVGSLHDVRVRLLAFLDQHYHVTAHASLMGRSPQAVYEAERVVSDVTEEQLDEALTVRGRRRVRRDGTLSIAGTDFELSQGFLSGRNVTVARSLLDPTSLPWVEHEDQRYELCRVDPKLNARTPRKPKRPARGIDAIAFDPPGALLDRALGRKPKHQPQPKD